MRPRAAGDAPPRREAGGAERPATPGSLCGAAAAGGAEASGPGLRRAPPFVGGRGHRAPPPRPAPGAAPGPPPGRARPAGRPAAAARGAGPPRSGGGGGEAGGRAARGPVLDPQQPREPPKKRQDALSVWRATSLLPSAWLFFVALLCFPTF